MTSDNTARAPHILIVGGGYAGFYTAKKLEKHLRSGEAVVTVVEPLQYMTYQPFLPEVAAGLIEPRHAVVPIRRHLPKTRVVTAKVTKVDHASKTVTITPADGEPWEESYDHIVVTAGSVSRTFPIPGIAENAIGLKAIEEAAAIRDRLVANFERASALPQGDPLRERLLTLVVVGGGFAGIEGFAELRSFASSLVKRYPTIDFEDTHFHLIEAMGRIMPEVSLTTAQWVIKNLAERGAQVHLETQLTSAVDGKIELSTGESFESDLIIWTAGVMANPVVRGTDLPVDERGRLRANAQLQVVNDDGPVGFAWTAGDVSAVPDISAPGAGVGGFCVPNAQHAVRQGKRLAKNIVAVLRGELPKDYSHKNLGAVAGLGPGIGAFQSGKLGITGLPAWFMHRGYHGLAIPMWERKFRVFGDWIGGFFLGRDQVGTIARDTPRHFFEEFASRPKPPAPAVESAPAEKEPAAKEPAAKAPAKRPAARKAAADTK